MMEPSPDAGGLAPDPRLATHHVARGTESERDY